MGLTLDQVKEADRIIIRVCGEVDLYSSPVLREAILKGISSGSGTVSVDLREVLYMDSSGVATLVEGLKASGKKGAAFVLLSPSEAVMKVLQLSRLDAVFEIKDTQ